MCAKNDVQWRRKKYGIFVIKFTCSFKCSSPNDFLCIFLAFVLTTTTTSKKNNNKMMLSPKILCILCDIQIVSLGYEKILYIFFILSFHSNVEHNECESPTNYYRLIYMNIFLSFSSFIQQINKQKHHCVCVCFFSSFFCCSLH